MLLTKANQTRVKKKNKKAFVFTWIIGKVLRIADGSVFCSLVECIVNPAVEWIGQKHKRRARVHHGCHVCLIHGPRVVL